MARIYIELDELKEISNNLSNIHTKINKIYEDFLNEKKFEERTFYYQHFEINNELYDSLINLKKQEDFLLGVHRIYLNLDNNIREKTTIKRFEVTEMLSKFGNFGKMYGHINKFSETTVWNPITRTKFLYDVSSTLYKIGKDVKNYRMIGRIAGNKRTCFLFLRKQLGLRKVGQVSKISSYPKSRFLNNLKNSSSPYNLTNAFGALTGKQGVGQALWAWAGVGLNAISNYKDNKKEQKNSKKKMSDSRVLAETVVETSIDTVVAFGGTAVVGAAIATVTGVVAAPAVVSIATGLIYSGINARVKKLTGKTATEWASDLIVNAGSKLIGDGKRALKTAAIWFKKLAFT